jgi:hypothetical protein
VIVFGGIKSLVEKESRKKRKEKLPVVMFTKAVSAKNKKKLRLSRVLSRQTHTQTRTTALNGVFKSLVIVLIQTYLFKTL